MFFFLVNKPSPFDNKITTNTRSCNHVKRDFFSDFPLNIHIKLCFYRWLITFNNAPTVFSLFWTTIHLKPRAYFARQNLNVQFKMPSFTIVYFLCVLQQLGFIQLGWLFSLSCFCCECFGMNTDQFCASICSKTAAQTNRCNPLTIGNSPRQNWIHHLSLTRVWQLREMLAHYQTFRESWKMNN